MIEVLRPDARSRDQEKREVEFQLRVWQAMHPETAVEIVD